MVSKQTSLKKYKEFEKPIHIYEKDIALFKIFHNAREKLSEAKSEMEVWDILREMDKKLEEYKKQYKPADMDERIRLSFIINKEVSDIERLAKRKLSRIGRKEGGILYW